MERNFLSNRLFKLASDLSFDIDGFWDNFNKHFDDFRLSLILIRDLIQQRQVFDRLFKEIFKLYLHHAFLLVVLYDSQITGNKFLSFLIVFD